MIAKYIRDKILHGDWFIGMKIPSHRKLAEQFNVNRVTIIKSIELLESESFIFTKEGSGTYVNDYLNNHSTFNNWAQSMEWSAKSRSLNTQYN
jgi:GntR family transcriptional regulator of abcA and norABC